ncbi:MAG: alpha/beta hydrolase [Chitinivibrionales bacterium]|nr:alpha/beta hydrolase [Chitinivibrionales bacterium]
MIERPRSREGYQPVELRTPRGSVLCRLYPATDDRRGVVWIGGIGGGFDTPALELYPRLCSELLEHGLSSLRVRYRNAYDLDECVYDTLAGLVYLDSRGMQTAAVVGHSLGGAVAIRSALRDPSVKLVVTLATQSYGAGQAGRLADDCALLLLHGENDEILPPGSSLYVYRLAHEPKELVVYPHTGHTMDEAAEQVHARVREWLLRYLKARA